MPGRKKKSEFCLVCGLKGVEVLLVRQKGSHTYQITAEGIHEQSLVGGLNTKFLSFQASCVTVLPWCKPTPGIKPMSRSYLQSLCLGEQVETPLKVHYSSFHPFIKSFIHLAHFAEHDEKWCAGCRTKQELCQELRIERRTRDSHGAYMVRKWIFSNYHIPH